MGHYFQERKPPLAGGAKLVCLRTGAVRCNHKIVLILDFEALLEVSLVREDFLQPTEIAECYRSPVVTNRKMVLWLARLYAGPTAAHKARLNSSDFQLTKAYGALLSMAHGANL